MHDTPRYLSYLLSIETPAGSFKSTALHRAIELGCKKSVLILLDNSVSVEGRDTYGWTALHSAAKVGDIYAATNCSGDF